MIERVTELDSDDDAASFKSIEDSEDEAYHSPDEDIPGTKTAAPPQAKRERPPRLGKESIPAPSRPTPDEIPSAILPPPERFPKDEENALLAQSNDLKVKANALFATGSYENALQQYDQALALCPNYLDYPLAILRSNISACNLKLKDWDAAVKAASKGLDCLENLEPLPKPVPKPKSGDDKTHIQPETNEVEEVTPALEARLAALELSGQTLDAVKKLQTKLLLRRSTASTQVATWSSLQSASEDLSLLLTPSLRPSLSPTDDRNVVTRLRELGPRLDDAKTREMAEMMGKLKGLGNSLLKPFGLSTSNFQFVKGEGGGYSMNFEQNPQKEE
ncbi:hypothetical protein B0A48_04733 [Cryoendolithus antarcticus]|uniref:Uncharacterized protein n=1 Tax=Cryoendolithus antarcticus TaxID=1507870 RepID=A0A1V8TD87_9PEZI|nr:hypothetical protein B0A48_04733 [Cryoendolithus antarcticus]